MALWGLLSFTLEEIDRQQFCKAPSPCDAEFLRVTKQWPGDTQCES